MVEYLESNDVARALGLSPSSVRVLVGTGQLRPAARTRRGVNLFRPRDVERIRQRRAPALGGAVTVGPSTIVPADPVEVGPTIVEPADPVEGAESVPWVNAPPRIMETSG